MILLMMLLALPVTKEYPAEFVSCYDGDTCTFNLTLDQQEIQMGLGLVESRTLIRKSQKIRLCDINAPELKPPNAAANKARDDLVSWIQNANQVHLRIPQKKNCSIDDNICDEFEKYGRLLGYIFADDTNLNEKQISQKNAIPFMSCE